MNVSNKNLIDLNMRHNNQNTIAIHITNQCNLRCPLCYLEKENKIIKYEYIQKAIKIFKPEYVVMFGGEAILCPDIIKQFHKDYPDIKIILHTNGTTYNTEIFDISSILYLTIESFFYSYNKIHRNMTYQQYKNFLKTISYCRNKIEAIHNIYPTDNDILFYKMAKLLGIPGTVLLVLGGIAYTVGAIFYGFGKKHKYIHSVFHLFILLGSILQFFTILLYVM